LDQRDQQNVAVAVVVLVLVLVGVWLMHTMRRNGLIEDCMMARRRNCEALLDK
jgi:hypothetical protein